MASPDDPSPHDLGQVLRQYACPHCTERRPFWGKPPTQTCDSCKRTLYPVPREDEIGYGQFRCSACQNEFTNGKARWSVTQPCYGKNGSQDRRQCSESVLPHSVGPSPRRHQRKSEEKVHRCAGCDSGACAFRPKSKTTAP